MVATVETSFKALESHYRDLHRFGVRLSSLGVSFQRMAREGKFPERGASFAYASEDPRDILNRSIDITRDFEFLVAVTGAFSSGKSTLLNVLLGHPDLLPSSAIPMTAVCTVIRHAAEPSIQVRFVPLESAFERVAAFLERPFKKPFHKLEQVGEALERPENFVEEPADRESLRRFARILSRWERITARPVLFEERHRFISGGGLLPGVGENGARWRYFLPTPQEERDYLALGGDPEQWVDKELLALIRDVTLWVDSPLLENNIVFLDLPGLNCREDYHRRAVKEYCNRADCILVTAFQAGNQADEEVIQNFKRLSSNYREKLFFVFNRVDQFASEPQELTRSFDYLTRDCIGQDFPRDRCFLTSAFLCRERLKGSGKFPAEFEVFTAGFRGYRAAVSGLEELLSRALSPADPGGVGHLRECLREFLREEAYRAKMTEVVENYDRVVRSLLSAASPAYEEVQRLDPREVLLRSVLEYYRRIEEMGRAALYGFRYDYLRGSPEAPSGLSQDLKAALERSHGELGRRIVSYFNGPLPTPPPREDPVREFDLCRIADDASGDLRRDFQDIITGAVSECLRRRFQECLERSGFREHLRNLFRRFPEPVERLERILERFELLLRHSVLCKVRLRFYSMPRGRDLKRFDGRVRLSEVKPFLIRVFSEFYPAWIHQNVYGEILNGLWLSFFLDAEDLEEEMRGYFEGCQPALTSAMVLEGAHIPEELSDGKGHLREVAGICKQIEEMARELEGLRSRSGSFAAALATHPPAAALAAALAGHPSLASRG